MSKCLRHICAVGAAIVLLTVVVHATEYNFYEQADKKGCASIITERGQDDCAAEQKTEGRGM